MKKIKNITNALLVALLSITMLVSPVMAEENIVDTTPVEGVIITTPTESSSEQAAESNIEESVINPTTKPATGSNLSGLKDDLYDVDGILTDTNVDLEGFFEKLTIKLRGLVTSMRKVSVPILVIAWIGVFLVAVARIATGERGASAHLVGALFWITFAYVGIVGAEGLLYSFAKFFLA